jgi:hypothetical protein
MTERHFGPLIENQSVLTDRIYYELMTYPSISYTDLRDFSIEVFRMELDTKKVVWRRRRGTRGTIHVKATDSRWEVTVNWNCHGAIPVDEADWGIALLNVTIHEAKRIEMALADGKDLVDLYRTVPKASCERCHWIYDIEAEFCPKCGVNR